MGLLTHLLFWPVTGPKFLTEFSLGKVNETVRQNLTDDESVKEELMALQMELELGDIDDEVYEQREAELMQRLRDVRYWREQFGMGTAGGPVQVRREPELPAADAADANGEQSGAESHGRASPAGGGIASPEGARIEVELDDDIEG